MRDLTNGQDIQENQDTHVNATPDPFGAIAVRQAEILKRFPVWEPKTLDQALDFAASEFPDRPYVITDDRSWTYRELQIWSKKIAAGLVNAGLKKGEHVALLMANYPEFVAVKFAISRVGAVAVPINFLNRRDELGYILGQSDAVMLITMDRFRNLDYLQFLDELAPGWEECGGGQAFPHLRQVIVFPTGDKGPRTGAGTLANLVSKAPQWLPQPDAVAKLNSDIIYTSGTTGSPKGVMLTHDMILRTAFGSAWGRAFEEGHRVLFSLPMYHVYGYVEGMLSVLFVGGAIVPQLKFDVGATLQGITHHQATDVLLIPTMTLALLDELKQRPHDLSCLHSILSSGGRSPNYIWQDIFECMQPRELTTGYGMTEVTASSTVTRPDDPLMRLLTTNGRLRDVGPAGDPSHGGKLVVYKVVDPETGIEVSPGEVGELLAKGYGVTSGYYNKPEATAEAFTSEGWLLTGDLGRIDADGYLTLVGRRKESYRCGGEQVLPSEIEDLLVTHPKVLQAHIVPVSDDRMGEVGAAFVVLRPQVTVLPQELIDFCCERLARFKVPKYVLPILAEELPTTPSGRARKFLLVKMANAALGLL